MKALFAILTLVFVSSVQAADWQQKNKEFCQKNSLGTILQDYGQSPVVEGSKRIYNLQNARFIKGVRRDQILKSIRFEEVSSVEEALERTDDNEIIKYDFTMSGLPADFYTVIYYYAGDNSGGAIFVGDSSEMVAEISDDDLVHCKFF